MGKGNEDTREVVRLLAGVHDDLMKVSTYGEDRDVQELIAEATARVKTALDIAMGIKK